MKWFAMLMLMAGPVDAACAPTADFKAWLAGTFKETRRATAIMVHGGRLEMWTTRKTGMWTVIFVQTNGITCLLGEGHSALLLTDEFRS